MCPVLKFFQQSTVQDIFERILFIWAHRHPASGYVQGMNDLVTPFFVVFLTQHVQFGQPIEQFDLASLDPTSLDALEADSYFCVSRLLDAIQDHYTPNHEGIRKKLEKLEQLVERIDPRLHAHLQANEIEYFQFAFRWMNNLLSRELPLHCCIRLWDTYLAESDNFADFHLYVCAAFLCRFSSILLDQRDFQVHNHYFFIYTLLYFCLSFLYSLLEFDAFSSKLTYTTVDGERNRRNFGGCLLPPSPICSGTITFESYCSTPAIALDTPNQFYRRHILLIVLLPLSTTSYSKKKIISLCTLYII